MSLYACVVHLCFEMWRSACGLVYCQYGYMWVMSVSVLQRQTLKGRLVSEQCGGLKLGVTPLHSSTPEKRWKRVTMAQLQHAELHPTAVLCHLKFNNLCLVSELVVTVTWLRGLTWFQLQAEFKLNSRATCVRPCMVLYVLPGVAREVPS